MEVRLQDLDHFFSGPFSLPVYFLVVIPIIHEESLGLIGLYIWPPLLPNSMPGAKHIRCPCGLVGVPNLISWIK